MGAIETDPPDPPPEAAPAPQPAPRPVRPAEPRRRAVLADVFAGLSVAFVVVPQGLAYAELAGMPAWYGLFASAIPPLVAAAFASSPWLQTGPTAVTSLLTFGALSSVATPASPEYLGLAALLAVMVGVIRVGLGLVRAGALAWFLSLPVLRGFTIAAALLILGSQLPMALGVDVSAEGVLPGAWETLSHPQRWDPQAIAMTAAALAVIVVGRRIHALFPGVLIAAVGGLLYATYGDYGAATIGAIPDAALALHLDLPWAEIPTLAIAATVIAVVGFAEPTAIARTFAAIERRRWDPNREFVSQGVANLSAGLVGAFPVGGSFSRSALNHVAGARTRWAGAVTGATALAFLPLAWVLASMPKAVLAAIVIRAVLGLMNPKPLWTFWTHSRPQALVAWTTFALTLALAPHVELALVAGIVLALVLHAWRETRVAIRTSFAGGTLTLAPMGVLWFASANHVEERFLELLSEHPDAEELVLDLSGLGRIDYSGALSLQSVMDHARQAGLQVQLVKVPPQCDRILGKVLSTPVRGRRSRPRGR